MLRASRIQGYEHCHSDCHAYQAHTQIRTENKNQLSHHSRIENKYKLKIVLNRHIAVTVMKHLVCIYLKRDCFWWHIR